MYDLLSKGFHMEDVGTERLSWHEAAVLVTQGKPSGDSALYRARFPKSWWWTPEFDFMAMQLMVMQGANWQRSGGQGDKPTLITAPVEGVENPEGEDAEGVPLSEIRNEMARRRAEIAAYNAQAEA